MKKTVLKEVLVNQDKKVQLILLRDMISEVSRTHSNTNILDKYDTSASA